MREVTVACENPRAAAKEERAKNVYHRAVAASVRKAGYPKGAVDWDYVETVRKELSQEFAQENCKLCASRVANVIRGGRWRRSLQRVR